MTSLNIGIAIRDLDSPDGRDRIPVVLGEECFKVLERVCRRLD
jgi:hypothetical protein